MSVTLTLGWWLIPALVTVLACAWAWSMVSSRPSGGSYDFGAAIAFMICFPIASTVSLAAWLIYAVLT